MAEEQKNIVKDPAAPLPAAPPAGDGKNKRIGERLVEQGIINKDQLEVALHEKQNRGRMIGEILVDLSFILRRHSLGPSSRTSTGLQQFDPKKTMIDPRCSRSCRKKTR